MTIRSTTIDAEIDQQVAFVKITQVFENHLDRARAGSLVFGLPDKAAISSFATWVEGHRVESQVEEKAQAKAHYERAAKQGAAPALLESLSPGVFHNAVEGIPALGTKRTELGYSQLLPYESGEVQLRIPMRVPGLSPARIGTFKARIHLRDPQKRIVSVSAGGLPAKVHRVDDHHVEVELAASALLPDQDLLIRYQVSGDALGFTFLANHDADETEGSFLLSIAPQELTTAKDLVKKDVLFVFDTSGSMGGTKIEEARRALLRCIALLQPEDHFSILAFSDGLNPWRNKALPATARNRKSAATFVGSLSAGGGTAINAALVEGLGTFKANGRPKVLIFFTDGQATSGVTNSAAIIKNVKHANTHRARVFAFGVQGGSNQTLLEKIATQNRGSAASIGHGEAIDQVVASFYRRIARPVLSDIHFEFDPVTVAMRYPQIMPDIYKGQQLIVAGRYRGDGVGTVILSGQLNGKTRVFKLPVSYPRTGSNAPLVARVWAKMRIDALLAEGHEQGVRSEQRAEVVRLGKRFHLITPYTSLVAAPRLALASLSPSRIKPGDPEVLIPAPEDARAVTLFLPFGPRLAARYDGRRNVWAARFLAPPTAKDGVYELRVVVTAADGSLTQQRVSYTIDTRAPVLSMDPLLAVEPGRTFKLRVRPTVNWLEVARSMLKAGAKDAIETAKTFADINYVSAFLWDGREIDLGLEPGESGWSATIETSRALSPGRHPIRIVAVDWAGNLKTLHASLVVRRHGAEVEHPVAGGTVLTLLRGRR